MKIHLQKFKLFTFIMLLFAFSGNVKAATITSTATGGNWSSTSTWVGGIVPSSLDNVTVVSGSTVTIDVNAEVKTVSVSGVLSFNDGIRLTVLGDIIVNAGGSFEILKENGSQSIATLIVYGNYNNNGSTNFWKGSVVIAGNLVSSTTSTIQNNGNVVVGGNIIGSFDTTGGDGSGQIYAVDPNATVTITPATIDGNVIPGVFPSTEFPALIDLVNLVLYGGACSFTVNDISSVSACAGSNAVFTVTTNASLPTTYLWQVNKNDGSGWVDLTGQTAASLNLSGVDITMNNYKYRAKITAGSPSCTKNGDYGVLMVNTTNTWNGASWSSGSSTAGKNIIFNGNYSSTSDLSGCSCQVTSGNVVINSGHTLTITKGVNVSGGSLTFKDKSSLVQINNVTNSGNITYERMTNTNVLNTDFTYWSSPVAPQTLFNLSPKTLSSQFFSYEVTSSTEDWKQESSGITMTIGKGYIVRGPESTSSLPPPPGFYKASFYGVPNNGDYAITGIYADKSYLLGNPYPSALDADAFLNDNAGVLNGTLYFWTHNTALSPAGDISDPGSGLLAYSSNDYASYNITGGVGIAPDITAAAPSGGTGGANISIPLGKIAAGQGFFGSSKITITGTNEIVFNNSMRLDNSGNTLDNSQFFKLNNTTAKTTKSIEKHRIWLNLTNSQGAFKQTLVGYITDATNEFDNRFDGESFDGNEFVDFYSVNRDKNLVIQGRALPFDEADEVPLGFRSTIEGTFTIHINQTDGLLKNQAVFIEDKLTKATFDLKSGDYTFTTVAGTFNERFVLRYTNKNAKTLSAADFATQDNPVLVSSKNKQIRINSAEETIDKVLVYDLAGKQIYHKTDVNSNELSISNLAASHQVLLVKTSLQNGRTVTNKIIY
jgi:hypothetical protein